MVRIVLWGTGERARETMDALPLYGSNVVAFIDNNPDKHGEFLGKPVYPASKLKSLDFDMLFIASTFYDAIHAQAIGLGIPAENILPAEALFFLKQSDKLTKEQLCDLNSIPFWYHKFEVLPGVVSPGICQYKPHLLHYPEIQDITGKNVLDIGAWDGPYTLEMTRRGGSVTGFDIQPPCNSAFNVTCRLNHIEAKHYCSNVYDLCPEQHGLYDIVMFFGVYYHLKNPLLAFENINAVLPVGGLLLFEGAILEGGARVDAYWKEHADLLPQLASIPYAYYVKETYEGEWSNWWVPNLCCLREWIESSGFEVLQMDTAEASTRGYGLARKVAPIGDEHMVLPPH